MIIEGVALDSDANRCADVCVIGGGVAGITLGYALGQRGFIVHVLESGGTTYSSRIQRLYRGTQSGQPGPPLDASRARYLGGSSNWWAGYLRRLDPVDFERRPWIDHSGWPITADDLKPYEDRAAVIGQIEGPQFCGAHWSHRLGLPLLPLDSRCFAQGATQIKPICFGYLVAELAAMENVKVFLNTTCLELLADADGPSIKGIVACTEDRRIRRFTARYYVLACGGIENARILLMSNSVRPCGIGNSSDMVGRFFMDHLVAVVGTLTLAQPATNVQFYRKNKAGPRLMVEGSLRLSSHPQRSEQAAGGHFSLMSPVENYIAAGVQSLGSIYHRGRRIVSGGALPQVFAQRYDAIIREFDEVVAYLGHKFLPWASVDKKTWLVKAEIEQHPHPESRVTLTNQQDYNGRPYAHVHWQTSEQDRHAVDRAVRILDGALIQSRLGRAQSLLGQGNGWNVPYITGHHHSGTTRMHPDPRRGVVDADCRVHDAPNLFVMGSSVFPTIGTAPPTFTILCLTLRLADRLTQLLQSLALTNAFGATDRSRGPASIAKLKRAQ